jgi:hypothetical protein
MWRTLQFPERRWPLATGLIGAAGLVVAGFVAPASGQSLPSPQSFTAPGTAPFVVPASVCHVSVDAIGAQGGIDAGGALPGGLGGEADATIPVTPGETLQVTVGGAGGQGVTGVGGSGGSPDGAAGGGGAAGGSGGGGSSSVQQGGNRVVIAGGGGGSAFGFFPSGTIPNTDPIAGGAGGGVAGQPGQTGGFASSGGGGGGGTQATAGGFGAGGNANPGDTGIPTGDGVGGSGFLGGGGGGGGLFGGGGGGGGGISLAGFNGGGGGGGSGFTPNGTGLIVGVDAHNNGNGTVTLTFAADPSCVPTSPAATTLVVAPRFTG